MMGKKDFLIDKRLSDRFIKRGSWSREEHRRYLDSLPDVAQKAERLVIENPHQAPHQTGAADDPAEL